LHEKGWKCRGDLIIEREELKTSGSTHIWLFGGGKFFLTRLE